MITQQLTLVQRELDILKKYLQEAILTDFNKKNLLSELASAQVVDEDELPENVIGLNSVVHVEERKSRKSFIFQIVPPAYADIKKNKIAVSAPIAIALLGYRTGSTIKWEMPGGVQEFEVLKVTRVDLERAV
nr:GreA/GreB family elongation factor [uncultured Mucilaginibacter sp.]